MTFTKTSDFSLESRSCPSQGFSWGKGRGLGQKEGSRGRRGGDRRARGWKRDLEAGGGAAGVHVTCRHQATTLGLSTVLPQVKELGVVMYNCSCLARDLTKIFEAYRFLGQAGRSSRQPGWPLTPATIKRLQWKSASMEPCSGLPSGESKGRGPATMPPLGLLNLAAGD